MKLISLINILTFIILILLFISCSDLNPEIIKSCETDKDCLANKDKIVCSEKLCIIPIEGSECNNDEDCLDETDSNATSICKDHKCEMGICNNGYFDINKDKSDGCEYQCTYSAEEDLCDGFNSNLEYTPLDNDCDGDKDEDVDLNSVETCGKCGINCNKLIEENSWTVQVSCLNNECDYKCQNEKYNFDGDWKNGCEETCIITEEANEICDGLDNNCDGNVDENLDCNCTSGNSEGCSLQNTVCPGTRDCDSSGVWGICDTGNEKHGIEICDKFDNDCDANVDEDFKTGEIYTDDNNCGECGNECEDNHSNNSCTSLGVCKAICNSGWKDFNANTNDGCETGCDKNLWLGLFSYKKIAGGTLLNDTEYADSFYDNNLVISYIKNFTTNNTVDLYAKIVDINGEDVITEKKITNLSNKKRAMYSSIVKKDNKYFSLLTHNETGIYKIYYTVLNSSNLITAKAISSISSSLYSNYNPYISKENYLANEIPIVWSENERGIYKTHYRTINSLTNELINNESVIKRSDCEFCNSFFPKVSTINSYTGILHCVKYSDAKSKLYLERIYSRGPQVSQLVSSFDEDISCKGNKSFSISSDGTSFYVSYINDSDDLVVNKYSSALVLLKTQTFNDFSSTYLSSSISYNLDNLIIAYTYRYFNILNYNNTYNLSTYRLNSNLDLKNVNYGFRTFVEDLFDANINVYYTDNNEALIQYSTNTSSSATDIEISRTDSCEN